jgi:hypothetical protein
VAEALVKSGVPFAFASGYGKAGLARHLQSRPILQKPFTRAELTRILLETLRG